MFYQFVDSLVLWSVFIFWSHDLNILLKLFYAQLTLFLHRNLLRILHKEVINLLFNELFVAVLVFSVYFHRHQYSFLHCIRHMGEQNFQREVLFIFIDPAMHHLHRFLLLTKRLQVALLLTLKPFEYKVFEGVVLYFLICLVLKVQIPAWGFFIIFYQRPELIIFWAKVIDEDIVGPLNVLCMLALAQIDTKSLTTLRIIFIFPKKWVLLAHLRNWSVPFLLIEFLPVIWHTLINEVDNKIIVMKALRVLILGQIFPQIDVLWALNINDKHLLLKLNSMQDKLRE